LAISLNNSQLRNWDSDTLIQTAEMDNFRLMIVHTGRIESIPAIQNLLVEVTDLPTVRWPFWNHYLIIDNIYYIRKYFSMKVINSNWIHDQTLSNRVSIAESIDKSAHKHFANLKQKFKKISSGCPALCHNMYCML